MQNLSWAHQIALKLWQKDSFWYLLLEIICSSLDKLVWIMVDLWFNRQLVCELYQIVSQNATILMWNSSEILLNNNLEDPDKLLITASLTFNNPAQFCKAMLGQLEPLEKLTMKSYLAPTDRLINIYQLIPVLLKITKFIDFQSHTEVLITLIVLVLEEWQLSNPI